MSKNKQWCTSKDGEYYNGEAFDTKKEAIADGKKEYQKNFWVGQIVEKHIIQFVCADNLLECINENANGEMGSEFVEDWLLDMNDKNKTDLEQLVAEFLEKRGYEPTFYGIENEEKIL